MTTLRTIQKPGALAWRLAVRVQANLGLAAVTYPVDRSLSQAALEHIRPSFTIADLVLAREVVPNNVDF